MNSIEIRIATVADLEILQKLSIQTFTETFAAVNSAENLEDYIKNNLNITQLTTELNNTNSQFFIAYSNREVIGYLKINFDDAQTEVIDTDALEIHRIYVLQTFHGKNIGHLLINKAISIAKSKTKTYVWLGVWEENYRALQFYTKNGFVVFDKHIFTLGNDKQTDLLMKLTIQ